MTIDQCKIETIRHIELLRRFLWLFINKLERRAAEHDKTKLESPEVEAFAKYTPLLAKTTYGSDDYNRYLAEMKEALDHHYAQNRHHPEHFEKGVDDMNLVDIVEMFCDWKASSLRHTDGNLLKSIEHNAKRFGLSDQLKSILINTAKMFDE